MNTQAMASQEYEVVLQRKTRPPETVLFRAANRNELLYAVMELYPGHVVKRITRTSEW